MIYNNKFTIKQTASFETEMEQIYSYIVFKLKEPHIAKKFYQKVIKKIYSLQYSPQRNMKIYNYWDTSRNLRKIKIDNYLIIYEVNLIQKEVIILHIFHDSQNYFKNL